jgi:hypothetical protein
VSPGESVKQGESKKRCNFRQLAAIFEVAAALSSGQGVFKSSDKTAP